MALTNLPPEPDRFRQLEFLLGMQAWRTHKRRAAEEHFDRVLTANFKDLADAISSHLIAVAMSGRGERVAAVTLLQRSIVTLRELQDTRGLCQALISLGIAEREISANLLQESEEAESGSVVSAEAIAQADKNFQAAQDALDEAVGLAREIEDSHLEGGAHLELAACFARWGDLDVAILEAETARSILSADDEEYVRALTQLGSFYRQVGDYDSAGRILGEAAQIALERGTEDIRLARLLNVQAANERRQGRLDIARSYAESSVRIGRRLKDRRHLGHALHTLGIIIIQEAEDTTQLGDADRLLSESEQILSALHDSVGLGMVNRTRTYFEERRSELRAESV